MKLKSIFIFSSRSFIPISMRHFSAGFILLFFILIPRTLRAQSEYGLDYSSDLNLPQFAYAGIVFRILMLLFAVFGIMAMSVALQGWFKLYVASGNEEKIAEAKRRLYTGAVLTVLIFTIIFAGNYFVSKTRNVMADEYADLETEENIFIQ